MPVTRRGASSRSSPVFPPTAPSASLLPMAQPMDIDAAGAAAITAELSKQASRAPTDNIANDRRISDRRDLA